MEKSINLKIPASFAADLAAWGRMTAKLFGEIAKYQSQSGEIAFPFPIPHLKRPRQIPQDEVWFWADEWQAGEREVNEDLKAGRFKVFDNVDDLIAALQS